MKSSYKKKAKTVVVNIFNLLNPRDKKKAKELLHNKHKYDSSLNNY